MKTIALIRLLFTFSQRPCSRQLGLSPKPRSPHWTQTNFLQPRRFQWSLWTFCLAQTPTTLQRAQIATHRTKLLECVSKTCSHWGVGGGSGLLSRLGSHCLFSGAGAVKLEKCPQPFAEIPWAFWSSTQKKANSNHLFYSGWFNVLVSYQRCHLWYTASLWRYSVISLMWGNRRWDWETLNRDAMPRLGDFFFFLFFF